MPPRPVIERGREPAAEWSRFYLLVVAAYSFSLAAAGRQCLMVCTPRWFFMFNLLRWPLKMRYVPSSQKWRSGPHPGPVPGRRLAEHSA